MRFRAIPQIPKGVLDPQLTRALEAIKENFELLTGQRGNDNAVTELLGFMPASPSEIVVPAGAVMLFDRTEAPNGWLVMDGSAVSRAQFPELFAVLGTRHGAGDGSTTFNLPDGRGEFFRGLDLGRGVDTGRALGSAQTDDFKSHTHVIGNVGSSGTFGLVDSGTASSSGTKITGATGGTETRPRNLAYLPCISTGRLL